MIVCTGIVLLNVRTLDVTTTNFNNDKQLEEDSNIMGSINTTADGSMTIDQLVNEMMSLYPSAHKQSLVTCACLAAKKSDQCIIGWVSEKGDFTQNKTTVESFRNHNWRPVAYWD